MIVARVDLRIVVENREQLDVELNRIIERDRTCVSGWIEDRYDDGRKPRGKKQLAAIAAVEQKLSEGG